MLDLDLITMQVQIEFAGLTGFTSAAFIHAPTALPGTGTAGVMTPAFTDSGFPVGVTGGTYDHTFDLQVASGYDPGFILATGGSGPFAISVALQTLLESFENGTTYLEIRSAAYPNGEIRGFFTEVPEPASAAMIALGAGALALRRRRR